MIFVLLIPELKREILYYLTCRSLVSLSLTCKINHHFIKNNNLFTLRKNRGYPRMEGHCVIHDISAYDILNQEDIIENLDLVKGDLLMKNLSSRRNDDTYIFDGYKIIPLDRSTYFYGELPKEFTVITNNIPMLYWYKTLYYYQQCWDERSYDYQNTHQINVIKIRDQCLHNIKTDGKTRFIMYKPQPRYQEILYTEFKYEEETYIIFIPPCYYSRICSMDYDYFKQCMNKSDIVEFCVDSSGLFQEKVPNSMWLP